MPSNVVEGRVDEFHEAGSGRPRHSRATSPLHQRGCDEIKRMGDNSCSRPSCEGGAEVEFLPKVGQIRHAARV